MTRPQGTACKGLEAGDIAEVYWKERKRKQKLSESSHFSINESITNPVLFSVAGSACLTHHTLASET